MSTEQCRPAQGDSPTGNEAALSWDSAGFFTVQLFRSHKSASDAFSSKGKNEHKKEKINITFNDIKTMQCLPRRQGSARNRVSRNVSVGTAAAARAARALLRLGLEACKCLHS